MICIFPPAQPGQPFARIWNEQLIRYAGYRDDADGRWSATRARCEFTAAMQGLGWRGKGEAFDVLPLAIETPAERRTSLRPARARRPRGPADATRSYGWFAELGLRWHAVPAISNMRLAIGGVHYPLAPFNGWYMGTEIGARNLADADRYDMLPTVARADGPGHQPRAARCGGTGRWSSSTARCCTRSSGPA